MPTAHCVSTLDGVILAVDAGFLALVGRAERDLVGHSYREITDPRDLDRSAGMLASLVDRAAPFRLQKRYLRPDGTSVAANLLVSRFDDPDRLVSTLLWNDEALALPPTRLWEAALRVRHVHAIRRAEFGNDLGADPVGSLLVSIYLAEAEGRAITHHQLAEEAGVAPSNARRWVRVLEEQGVVHRGSAAVAGIQFTAAGIRRMERTLASVYQLPDTVLRPH